MTEHMPKSESFNLVPQMRRAAISITANIAEGYGRYHYQENIQFLRVTRGSLYELLDHLIACDDLGYAEQEEIRKIQDLINQNIIKVNGFIKYLEKRKSEE